MRDKRLSILISFALLIFPFSLTLEQDPTFSSGANPPRASQWIAPGRIPVGWNHQIAASLPHIFLQTRYLASFVDFDDFGYSVDLDADTLVVGAPEDDGFTGAVWVFERDLGGTGYWGSAAFQTASDAQSSDFFGGSVALDGDTLVVGAYNENGGPGNPLPSAGAVYIYERNLGGPGNWGEAAILHASDAQPQDNFGGRAAIAGDTLIVGAASEDGGPADPFSDAGAVYIFERNLGGPENWGEAIILRASDAQENDFFGSSVALNENTLVIGAKSEDGGPGDPTANAGAAYIFERNLGGPENWGEAIILRASDAQENDFFGSSVALDKDTLVSGAKSEDGGPGDPTANAGAAYIFERDLGGPDNWGEKAILRASNANQNDYFGLSMSLDEDTLVIGSETVVWNPGDPLPISSGAVYVFERNFGGQEKWGEAAILQDIYYSRRWNFGRSVALEADTLAATAGDFIALPPLYGSGAAYIFERTVPIFLPIILK